LDLAEISRMCPFNYTGADFYALCSDAMLKAMTRAADRVDEIVRKLNLDSGDLHFPKPLTVQYYLASLAQKEDIEVRVGKEDFMEALQGMKPSVSESEMKHYEKVQQDFKGFDIGANK
jgi:peroxin-6